MREATDEHRKTQIGNFNYGNTSCHPKLAREATDEHRKTQIGNFTHGNISCHPDRVR
jgi:hypothetical protein